MSSTTYTYAAYIRDAWQAGFDAPADADCPFGHEGAVAAWQKGRDYREAKEARKLAALKMAAASGINPD